MAENQYMELLTSFLDQYEKAKQLVVKLDEVGSSQDFLGVFALAHSHGFDYTGSSWNAELEALREALKKIESLPDPSKVDIDSLE